MRRFVDALRELARRGSEDAARAQPLGCAVVGLDDHGRVLPRHSKSWTIKVARLPGSSDILVGLRPNRFDVLLPVFKKLGATGSQLVIQGGDDLFVATALWMLWAEVDKALEAEYGAAS